MIDKKFCCPYCDKEFNINNFIRLSFRSDGESETIKCSNCNNFFRYYVWVDVDIEVEKVKKNSK